MQRITTGVIYRLREHNTNLLLNMQGSRQVNCPVLNDLRYLPPLLVVTSYHLPVAARADNSASL